MTSLYPIKLVGDVLVLQYGKPLPESERTSEGGVPAYGANGVLCQSRQAFRTKPSIIVGRKGSAGEVNLTEGPFWPTDVTYFVEHDERVSDLRYLFYALKLLNLQKLAKGVKPGVNRNDVYALKIPMPSLPEQKRIVTIFDEAFEGIDTVVANAEKNLAHARELFESCLNNAVSKECSKWNAKSIGNLCIIGDGNHSSKYPKNSEMVSEGVPFIRSTNIVNGKLSWANIIYISEKKHEELKKGHLKTGDVLFTNRGEIGKVAIVDETFNGANLNSQIAWLRCRGEIIPRYLFFFLKSGNMRAHFQQTKSGTALQQFTIRVLKDVPISFPRIDVQWDLYQPS